MYYNNIGAIISPFLFSYSKHIVQAFCTDYTRLRLYSIESCVKLRCTGSNPRKELKSQKELAKGTRKELKTLLQKERKELEKGTKSFDKLFNKGV